MVGNFRKTFRPPTKQENSKMKLNLKIWRQENAQSKGRMVPYTAGKRFTPHVLFGNA